MSELPENLDSLPPAEQITKLKEAVATQKKEIQTLKDTNAKQSEELAEFKDVVKRVKMIVREA